MFSDLFEQTKWREPYLVGRCLGAAENVRFIGCYGGSKPPPYGVCAKRQHTDKSKFEKPFFLFRQKAVGGDGKR